MRNKILDDITKLINEQLPKVKTNETTNQQVVNTIIQTPNQEENTQIAQPEVLEDNDK